MLDVGGGVTSVAAAISRGGCCRLEHVRCAVCGVVSLACGVRRDVTVTVGAVDCLVELLSNSLGHN